MNTNAKPTLLAYLNGMPDLESTYPVLARLHQRGVVNVKTLVYSKLIQKEPRLLAVFKEHGYEPTVASKFRMKLLYQKDIKNAAAVLTIADPLWDTTTRKQRGSYMMKINQRPIYLQHGVYQRGVNARWVDEPMQYYSRKLLFWEPLAANRELFEPDVQAKIEVVGFTKKDLLPRPNHKAAVLEKLKNYKTRLLVCQSFRWGHGRHDANNIGEFYDLLDSFLTRNPDVMVIIRSHRGKIRGNHRWHDKQLLKNHDNVMFSFQRKGDLANYAIQDVVDLCDAMVSPVSTTVLDALYMGKPVAVFKEGLPLFQSLPQVECLSSLECFVNSLDKPNSVYSEIVEHFGDIEENLDKACRIIESEIVPSFGQAQP